MAKENPMKQMKKKMYMDKYVYSGKHWSELKFYGVINCPKEYMLFDDETMGQTHTQMGCYASASERLFDRIDNL